MAKYKNGAVPKDEGGQRKLHEDLEPAFISEVIELLLAGETISPSEFKEIVSCLKTIVNLIQAGKIIKTSNGKTETFSKKYVPRLMKRFPILKSVVCFVFKCFTV